MFTASRRVQNMGLAILIYSPTIYDVVVTIDPVLPGTAIKSSIEPVTSCSRGVFCFDFIIQSGFTYFISDLRQRSIGSSPCVRVSNAGKNVSNQQRNASRIHKNVQGMKEE